MRGVNDMRPNIIAGRHEQHGDHPHSSRRDAPKEIARVVDRRKLPRSAMTMAPTLNSTWCWPKVWLLTAVQKLIMFNPLSLQAGIEPSAEER